MAVDLVDYIFSITSLYACVYVSPILVFSVLNSIKGYVDNCLVFHRLTGITNIDLPYLSYVMQHS